ncbi:hypothetical protein M409DRAFT_68361 [Zasmidium cellare ATCC 36951]|uniref:NAD dependent epimerase/dehydratase n=1 Tax=Zasmidium cellare ATCC 36951 TaxID=1080233 RepID=A0A6A6CD00_ZASCE|nr:uncharacterized protein M409DRAFT_68361 [Zasmidium cellare ATCC 36951]KAF2163802.1 hypothetical protein M409DRAFT_68361 [Zasmidium cellare ATCC 36951]
MTTLQMHTTNAFLALAKIIYPIQEPNLKRDRPLEVLCLGLSRSGTESLSKALVLLGYDETYHGLQVVSHRVSDVPQWHRLGKAKMNGDKAFLCAEEFDRILGHCMAVTDSPCCIFSEELIRCYPQAKVVLNKRRDVKAWEQSVKGTLIGIYSSWPRLVKSFFLTELFWLRLWTQSLLEPLFVGAFEQNPHRMGELYEKHYDDVKEVCRVQGRQYLEWSVEDGWEPLCQFLGKPVPKEPFPQGNSTAEFQAFKSKVQDPRNEKATRNIVITAATVVTASIALFAYYRQLQ